MARGAYVVDDERHRLALARWLALDINELRRVGDRVEDDHELRGQLKRQDRLISGRQLDRIEYNVVHQLLEVRGQIDARAPEYLAAILGHGQTVGVVRLDPAYPWADRKRHLHHLVEGRFVPSSAE